MTTCFNFMRPTASATRCGSSSSNPNGFAVVTAQNPHARVQRSPAIMKVAVPWLQHSQRFGHCALSQTVCSRRSEISALVEKKTGFDGSRTLIHGGFCAWCRAGSIFGQDISEKVTVLKRLQKLNRDATHSIQQRAFFGDVGTAARQFRFVSIQRHRYHRRRVSDFSYQAAKLKPD